MITLDINWLGHCPNCHNDVHQVTTTDGTPKKLWSGDYVVCPVCDLTGEIDADGENAWVDWDVDEDDE